MEQYKIGETDIIAVDQGFGNIKTRNYVFKTGVKKFSTIPPFGTDILEYKGNFYLIGEGHKPFMADKVLDEDYLILTMAGLAKELRKRNKTDGRIILAVGLPITWLSNQKEEFENYLMQDKNMEFTYKGIMYHIEIERVMVFPQGFAAVASNLAMFDGVNILADIGNGTMNTLYINDHKPQANKFYTDKLGVQQCINQIKNRLLAVCGSTVQESQIEDYLITKKSNIKQEYIDIMKQEAEEYVREVFSKLVEYDYNPDLMKLYVVGGGGKILENFGEYDTSRVVINSDICATAKGYEVVAYNCLLREKKLGA